MKQNVTITLKDIEVKGVKVGGVCIAAEYEADKDEIAAQETAWEKVIDKLKNDFPWFFNGVKDMFEASVDAQLAFLNPEVQPDQPAEEKAE